MIIIIYDTNNGTKDALKEEKKGFNDGDYKNMKDLWVNFQSFFLHILTQDCFKKKQNM